MGAATFTRLAHTIPNEILADFKYSNEICYNVAHQQSHNHSQPNPQLLNRHLSSRKYATY